MSFFGKKSKKKANVKSTSDSPKLLKKSDNVRAKSTPQAPILAPVVKSKSYSKTRSHDPDITLGMSKMSLKSMDNSDEEDEFVLAPYSPLGGSPELPGLARQLSTLSPVDDTTKKISSTKSSPSLPTSLGKPKVKKKANSKFHQAVSSESDEERSYTSKAYTKPQPPKGATKSAPSFPPAKMKAENSAPSKFHQSVSSEDEYEGSYTGHSKTKSQPPKGATKSAPSFPPAKMKAKKSVPSKFRQDEVSESPPAYGKIQQDDSPGPPLYSKAKATKSTPSRLHQVEPPPSYGKVKASSGRKTASKFQKGDTVDMPPSYDKVEAAAVHQSLPSEFPQDYPMEAPPPLYEYAVGGDKKETATESTAESIPPDQRKIKDRRHTEPPVSGPTLPPPPPPLPPAPKMEELSLNLESPVAMPIVVDNGPPRYPTKSAGGLATDLHFEIVAEELSPGDLPGLCRHLGLTATKVEQIQYDNKHLKFQEQVIAILQEWKKKAGRQVTLKALLQALSNSGNTMTANIIEDRLKIKGDVLHEVKPPSTGLSEGHPKERLDHYAVDKCSPFNQERTLKERLDDDGRKKFARAMSELKTTYKEGAHGQVESPAESKYVCPKCNLRYGTVTLLQYHVDKCIDDPTTRSKVKMQVSRDSEEQESTVDDNTIKEVASHLQDGEWQKLAYQLGFVPHAIKKFEIRQPGSTAEEKADSMLKDWRRRQKKGTDLVLRLTGAMRSCELPQLVKLADKISAQHRLKGLQSPSGKVSRIRYQDTPGPSTIDEETLRQMSSQLGRDWKKLAQHLDYSPRALQRLQSRQPNYNSQEQALYMLKDWIRRQPAGVDVYGTFANKLQKCGERHLAELAEWLRKQQAGTVEAGAGAAVTSEERSPSNSPRGTGKSRGGSHVMISYQWNAQKRALKLKEQLTKAGYSVWMDVDKMGGDLLGSMADAVENAAVIILCVSRQYKESNNCRGEASYAFQLKKPIIPVIVEEGYSPDGWLGMVISMRLYYRMYNDEVMKSDLPALINDIGDKGRSYQDSIAFSARATPSAIDSFDLKNKCKAYVYLCDPQSELLPHADVWVTMFLDPSLKVFKDETSKYLLAAGGDNLQKRIRALSGTTVTPLKVGTVLQTTPGDLPCKKAYHIIYKENVHSAGYVAELHSAFSECVWLAQHGGSTSIAFSLFTNQEAFEFNNVVLQVVDSVMKELTAKDQGSLRRVLFVTQKTSIVKKISNELFHAVSLQQLQQEVKLFGRSVLKNGTNILVCNGNVLDSTTDAIVISVSSSYQRIGVCGTIYRTVHIHQPVEKLYGKFTLKNGTLIRVSNGNLKFTSADAIIVSVSNNYLRVGVGLSGSIYKAGGPSLQAEFNEYTKKTHSPGNAFKTTNGRLPCGRVIYAVVPSADITTKGSRKDLLAKSVINSLKLADADKCTSVAVPAIGANYGHFTAKEGSWILVGSVLQYFEENPTSSIKELQFLDINSRCCDRLMEALAGHDVLENIVEDSPDGAVQAAGGGDEDKVESETEMEIEETPAEILARGPAARQAYLEASRDGTKPVYRTRLMLVGQERVGKTSLMKNLSGQRFDETESITDGVDATTLCKVPGDSAKPWKLQDSAIKDLANHVQSEYIEALCTLMAQRLTELGEREQTVDSADEQQEEEELLELLSQMKDMQLQGDQTGDKPDTDAPPAAAAEDKQDDLEPDSAPMSEGESDTEGQEEGVDGTALQTTEQQVPEIDVSVPDAILQKLRQVLREKKRELKEAEAKRGVDEFQIWDFAGQDVYYTTHQVFLSNRALYMVIFDLRLDLNTPVKVEVFHNDKVQSRFHDFTGLGFLDFWMQSIYAYATTNQQTPDEDRPQLSPPIFIVGTHRESVDISPDPEERKRLVSEKFQSINEMIAGKPYEQHVVSKYYAIENSSNDQEDSELSLLRQAIASIASQESYMGEKIPLRWLTFEKSVAEAISKGQHYMNLTQVRDLTRDLGVTEDSELFTMLHFYHDLGTIIYFGGEDNGNRYLQDMVILNPQWLIDIFKRIITVMPHQKQWATMKNKWRRLKEEGILEDHLIDHMWTDLLPQKPALLALMEMFDLLCPRLNAEEVGDVHTYYVPACLQHCSEEEARQELEASGKPVTFYIDFQGFLPDGLFHRLLVHAARWSQQQSGEEPQLYFRYGSFCLDDEHNFQLEMKATDPVCIKITICKVLLLSPDGKKDNSNVEAQPCPKACSMVRTFLSHTLNELMYTWIHGIKYEFSVACPCNDLQQTTQADVQRCFHLLHLEECLARAKIKCKGKKMWVPTEVFKNWFHKKVEEEQEDDIDRLKKANITLSDVELFEVAGEVGSQWKKLGLYLGLRACHIASLNSEHPATEDKAFHTLIQWHEGLSKKDNARGLLCKALKKCGLASLSESYQSPKDVQ